MEDENISDGLTTKCINPSSAFPGVGAKSFEVIAPAGNSLHIISCMTWSKIPVGNCSVEVKTFEERMEASQNEQEIVYSSEEPSLFLSTSCIIRQLGISSLAFLARKGSLLLCNFHI